MSELVQGQVLRAILYNIISYQEPRLNSTTKIVYPLNLLRGLTACVRFTCRTDLIGLARVTPPPQTREKSYFYAVKSFFSYKSPFRLLFFLFGPTSAIVLSLRTADIKAPAVIPDVKSS